MAMELRAWFGGREDAAANTPPLSVVWLIISLAASAGDDVHIGTAHVTVAFFHLMMDIEMYVRPLRGSAPLGFVWCLARAL